MVGNGYPAMEAYCLYADQAGAHPQIDLQARRRDASTLEAPSRSPLDGGGGDMALDRGVSWATCETTPDGAAIDPLRHLLNDHRTWSRHG